MEEYIFGAAILYIEDAFYVFGGSSDVRDTRIGKLDSEHKWSKVGELRTQLR